MSATNDAIRAAQQIAAGDRLAPVWKPAHLAWLARPPRDRVPTEAALDHALRSLRGDDIPLRVGTQKQRFSASSVGGAHGVGFSCHRATLFHFIGAPKIPPTPQELMNMEMGSSLHLAFQIEGISAGYITSCETWDYDEAWRYGAKDDGILYDGSLLELKFVKATKFNDILRGNRQYRQLPGPLHAHLLQMIGIMYLKGLTHGSLVYVNKENGESEEYRIAYDEELRNELFTLLVDLNDWVNLNELPTMLDGCSANPMARQGYMATHCEYRDYCPHVRTVLGGVT